MKAIALKSIVLAVVVHVVEMVFWNANYSGKWVEIIKYLTNWVYYLFDDTSNAFYNLKIVFLGYDKAYETNGRLHMEAHLERDLSNNNKTSKSFNLCTIM